MMVRFGKLYTFSWQTKIARKKWIATAKDEYIPFFLFPFFRSCISMNSLEMKRWTYADTKHLLQLDPSRWPSLRNVVSQLRAVSTWHIYYVQALKIRVSEGWHKKARNYIETCFKYLERGVKLYLEQDEATPKDWQKKSEVTVQQHVRM